jgi:hypothetical protein
MSIGTDISDPSVNTFIVNYYFSVDSNTSLITGFYSYNNIGINLLAPLILPPPFDGEGSADNYFDENLLFFGNYTGTNFIDNQLATYLTSFHSFTGVLQYFNFYSDGIKNIFWGYINNAGNAGSNNWSSNYIQINKINGPPIQKKNNFFSMRSAYTNNAQVFYKPHSLASGGVGGTRNCRIKSKKT